MFFFKYLLWVLIYTDGAAAALEVSGLLVEIPAPCISLTLLSRYR